MIAPSLTVYCCTPLWSVCFLPMFIWLFWAFLPCWLGLVALGSAVYCLCSSHHKPGSADRHAFYSYSATSSDNLVPFRGSCGLSMIAPSFVYCCPSNVVSFVLLMFILATCILGLFSCIQSSFSYSLPYFSFYSCIRNM